MNIELKRLMDRVKDATGYPVTVVGDSEMSTHSRMVAATLAHSLGEDDLLLFRKDQLVRLCTL